MSVQRRNLTPALGNLQFENVDYSPIERAGQSIAQGIEKRAQNKKDAYAQDRLDMTALADHMDGVQGADIEAQHKATVAGVEKLKSALEKYGRNSPEYLSVYSGLNIALAKDQQSYKNWDKITQQFLAITKTPPNNLDMVAARKKFIEEGKRPISERSSDFINQLAVDPELFRWSGSITDSLNEGANPQKYTYNVETKEAGRTGVTQMTQEYNAATQTIDKNTHKVLSNISDERYLNAYLKNPQVFDNVIYQKYPEIKHTIAEGFTGDGGTAKWEKFKELVNHMQPDVIAATAGELKWRTEIANPYNSATLVKSAADQAKETAEIAGLQSILTEKASAGVIGAKFGGIATQTADGGWSIKVKGIRQPYVFSPAKFAQLAGELYTRSRKAAVGASAAPDKLTTAEEDPFKVATKK